MIQSLVIYSLLLATMIFFNRVTAKNGGFRVSHIGSHSTFWKFHIIFPIILFAIVFGIRYDVGTDHLQYLYRYTTKTDDKYEYLYALIGKVAQFYNWHFAIYFSILAFLEIFFFYYAFNSERYLFPFLTFFLFTNENIFFLMNGIRQGIALCIWLSSLRYIEEKKLLKYLMWCIIAYFFHRSAIVLIIFYPLLKSGRDYFGKVSFQIVLIITALIIQRLFSSFLINLDALINSYSFLTGTDSDVYSERFDYERIQEGINSKEGSSIVYILKLMVNVYIVSYSNKMKRFYNSNRFIIVYFFFFIGLITLYIFPIGTNLLTRPFRYFYFFTAIVYAYFTYFLFHSRKGLRRMEFYFFILLFLSLFYLSLVTSNPEAHKWYQFYFDVN